MAYTDIEHSCFTCFWMWEDNGSARCTRMPPMPMLLDPAVDITTQNIVRYVPCPLRPACGEWIPLDGLDEDDELLEEVLGEQLKD